MVITPSAAAFASEPPLFDSRLGGAAVESEAPDQGSLIAVQLTLRTPVAVEPDAVTAYSVAAPEELTITLLNGAVPPEQADTEFAVPK